MKLAICGYSQAGCSTVFDALIGAESGFDERRANRLQVVPVPDPRLDRLAADYEPKKITPATVTYEDFAGFGGDKYFGELRNVDALICVIRGFRNDSVAARNNAVDWKRDHGDFESELSFADYALVEKNIETLKRATRHKAASTDKERLAVLERLLPILEDGRAAHEGGLTPEERVLIRDFQLLTLKPRIMLVNVGDDDDLAEMGIPEIPEFEGDERPEVVTCGIRGRLEAEVAQLPADERAEFLEDFGLAEVVSDRLLRISYAYLDLISFLTAGEKEVRAWTIKRGLTAPQAAGKIHSDLERGFIRAEVTAWSDYLELGSVKAAKEAGKWRLEGKTYIVQDGDLIEIRHNG